MKEKIQTIVNQLRSTVSTKLIKFGLKKESVVILDEREHARNAIIKKDFDKVYTCIGEAKTPSDITAVEKLVNNFNRVYGEYVNDQYIPASESYIFNVAIQLKYTEIYEGVY